MAYFLKAKTHGWVEHQFALCLFIFSFPGRIQRSDIWGLRVKPPPVCLTTQSYTV